MKNYTFLLPLYNDWESFSILLPKINFQMKKLKKKANILIVNDCSKNKMIKYKKLSNISKIEIISLNTNVGSQKAISIGLTYLKKIKKETIVTVMDSDGEDDASKISYMIKKAEKKKDKVIVSSRTKRHENLLFKILYFFHKFITFIFTLSWISFGSFSSFHSNNLKNILKNNSSWLAFSACISKNCKTLKTFAERKKRFLGNSKLSFYGLMKHSLRVNAVFFQRIIFFSFIYAFVLTNFVFFNSKFNFYLIALLILYNTTIFSTIILNNCSNFKISNKFIKSLKKI